MDPSIAENKMEDSGSAGESALQVSVSFGRFANDSLSWEKCSVFPADTPLEEVGKFSPAGSVAQKKAYFEAHYKNMAARKAEQEDKDKKKGIKVIDHVDSGDQTQRDSASEFSAVERELDVDKSNGRSCDNVIELESKVRDSKYEIISSEADETKGSVDEIIESKGSLPPTEDVKDDFSCSPGNPEITKSEEPLMVKEEALPLGSEEVEESPKHIDDTRASDDKEERGKVKSEKSLKSQKFVLQARTISTSGVKKTPTSSTPKSLVMPTSKLSRPTLSKSITPTPKGLSKKENGTSPMTSKKPNSLESRRVAPTSLHMSINLNPSNSEPPTSTTMRKSLIMERMGDKDIVKRAFKAFRSNSNEHESSIPIKPSATSEIIGKESEVKASVVGTPQKKTEGGNKLVKKSSPLSGQTGLGKNSNPTRVSNTAGADQRNNRSVSSTHGLRSRDKADQGNKVSKKLEDKVNGKPSGRTQLQSKEKKELEIKRLRNSCNTKTKPVSGTFASNTLA